MVKRPPTRCSQPAQNSSTDQAKGMSNEQFEEMSAKLYPRQTNRFIAQPGDLVFLSKDGREISFAEAQAEKAANVQAAEKKSN